MIPEPSMLAVVLLGALVAGFSTGFAGFGTGLVASGLWFHALPAPMVPPLVALASIAAQAVGLVIVRKAFDWRRAAPFLVGGGFLGGFAGLSGPLPLVWLQLRGGSSAEQRATYQPFNLVVLGLAGAGMAISGQIDGAVVAVAALCLPVTLLGAWIGARAYTRASEATFRRVVLVLLLCSGAILVGQSVPG